MSEAQFLLPQLRGQPALCREVPAGHALISMTRTGNRSLALQ
jgi:hypothetical protein